MVVDRCVSRAAQDELCHKTLLLCLLDLACCQLFLQSPSRFEVPLGTHSFYVRFFIMAIFFRAFSPDIILLSAGFDAAAKVRLDHSLRAAGHTSIRMLETAASFKIRSVSTPHVLEFQSHQLIISTSTHLRTSRAHCLWH
jgi:hypothetical protein